MSKETAGDEAEEGKLKEMMDFIFELPFDLWLCGWIAVIAIGMAIGLAMG